MVRGVHLGFLLMLLLMLLVCGCSCLHALWFFAQGKRIKSRATVPTPTDGVPGTNRVRDGENTD